MPKAISIYNGSESIASVMPGAKAKHQHNNGVDDKARPGSCGYIALGVSREQIYETLKAHLHDERVRSLLADQIRHDFEDHNFHISDGMKNTIVEKFSLMNAAQQHRNDLIAEYRQHLSLKGITLPEASIEDLLPHFIEDEHTCHLLQQAKLAVQATEADVESYLRSIELIDDYIESNVMHEWLGVHVMLAYAELNHIRLYIWRPAQESNSISSPLSLRNEVGEGEEFHIFHNGSDHYERLFWRSATAQDSDSDEDDFSKASSMPFLMAAAMTSTSIVEHDKWPHYVANIPVQIHSDDEAGTSDGEESDDEFPSRYFENPLKYFRLMPDKLNDKVPKENKTSQGMHGPLYFPTSEELLLHKKHTKRPDRQIDVLKLLEQQSFGVSSKESAPIAKERLAVSFGLNKMRSLSKTRNQALGRAFHRPLRTNLTIERTAFFWDGVWQESESGDKDWRQIDYIRVLKFYRQLKRKDSAAATNFRRVNESKSRRHMVPYREIREEIKNHSNTQALVAQHRAQASCADVYLAVLDSDMRSLRSHIMGAFSVYDSMWQKHAGTLEMASTGYVVDATQGATIAFAAEFDLVVRMRTAAYIKAGVYYPEPSSIVKVPRDAPTVPESFIEGSRLVYESGLEMPILLGHMIAARKIDPQVSLDFDCSGAVVTTAPTRMETEISARFTTKGKLVHWRLADFKSLRNVSQSHYNNLKWAKNVLNVFSLPVKLTLRLYERDVLINRGSIIREGMLSLISRLFKAYDPIVIAELRLEEMGFQKTLLEVLGDYNRIAPHVGLRIERDKKEEGPKFFWDYCDSCKDIGAIKEAINLLLSKAHGNKLSADDIEAAAKNSGQGIAELLSSKLCLDFAELSSDLMIDLMAHVAGMTVKAFERRGLILSEAYQMILDATVLDNRKKFINYFEGKSSRSYGPYQTTPLHWAAITGSKEIVNYLLEKKDISTYGWVGSIHQQAQYEVLPIHCAIVYCAQNGIDEMLLARLCDRRVIVLTEEGKSLFQLVMERSDDPIPFLRFFIKSYGRYLRFDDEFLSGKDIKELLIKAICRKETAVAEYLAQYCEAENIVLDKIYEDAADTHLAIVKWAYSHDYDVDRMLSEMSDYDYHRFREKFEIGGWEAERGSASASSYDVS